MTAVDAATVATFGCGALVVVVAAVLWCHELSRRAWRRLNRPRPVVPLPAREAGAHLAVERAARLAVAALDGRERRPDPEPALDEAADALAWALDDLDAARREREGR